MSFVFGALVFRGTGVSPAPALVYLDRIFLFHYSLLHSEGEIRVSQECCSFGTRVSDHVHKALSNYLISKQMQDAKILFFSNNLSGHFFSHG